MNLKINCRTNAFQHLSGSFYCFDGQSDIDATLFEPAGRTRGEQRAYGEDAPNAEHCLISGHEDEKAESRGPERRADVGRAVEDA